MKKYLLLVSSVVVCAMPSAAQHHSSNSVPKVPASVDKARIWDKKMCLGDEPIGPVIKPLHNTNGKTSLLIKIGETSYDLQSNGSVRRQIFNTGDGTLSAAWTFSNSMDLGSPDRGTGYNYYNGTSWQPVPNSRIEPFRTGWGNIGVTGKNEEIAIAHQGSGNLAISRRTKGSGSWTTGTIPGSGITTQYIWPRIAIGGPGDSTVHVIAVTAPSAFGGPAVQGLDGALVYFRSPDGGYTWDIIDSVLPGLDTTNFANCPQKKGFGGDEYAITAKGNTVVITVFDDWNDVIMLKSTDNGNTWTKTIIYDVLDNPQANTDTIESSDNCGAVVIDNSGNAHVFFGVMRYLDDNFTDDQYSYFPATNGLYYWNESMGGATGSGTTNAVLITGALDLDNDGQLNIADINEIALYYASLSSMPSAGVDASNNIYLVYSAIAENLYSGSQFYRHIYVMKSTNGGSTWSQPVDILTNQNGNGPYDFSEAVFPDLADLVDNNLHIIFQEDNEPGLAVRGDQDPFVLNNIYYYRLSTDLNVTLNLNEIPGSYYTISLYPNPANGKSVTMQLDSHPNVPVTVEIYNTLGQLVSTHYYPQTQNNLLTLPVEHLSKGIYSVRIIEGSGTHAVLLVRE